MPINVDAPARWCTCYSERVFQFCWDVCSHTYDNGQSDRFKTCVSTVKFSGSYESYKNNQSVPSLLCESSPCSFKSYGAHLPACLPVHPSACPSICLSIIPSVRLSPDLYIRHSVNFSRSHLSLSLALSLYPGIVQNVYSWLVRRITWQIYANEVRCPDEIMRIGLFIYAHDHWLALAICITDTQSPAPITYRSNTRFLALNTYFTLLAECRILIRWGKRSGFAYIPNSPPLIHSNFHRVELVALNLQVLLPLLFEHLNITWQSFPG